MNTIEKTIQNFYDFMLEKAKWDIENLGEINPHVHVLTTSKKEGAFDINVMQVPSLVELMNNGTPKEVVIAKELIEGFVDYLKKVEGKSKIAVFHSELYINEEGEYLYTYQMNEGGNKVCRYKVNRSNMGVREDGHIVNEVEIELLDAL